MIAATRRFAEALQTVFELYPLAPAGDPVRPELLAAIRDCQRAVADLPAVASRPSLKVDSSVGVGRQAQVPWVAIFDPRETDTTRQGVYGCFLLRRNMSGLYLTLAQGVTGPQGENGRDTKRHLREIGDRLRTQLGESLRPTFDLDGPVDLGPVSGMASNYPASVVAHRFYPAGGLPDDTALDRDLEVLLTAYQQYVDEKQPRRDNGAAPEAPGTPRAVRERPPQPGIQPPFDREKAIGAVREYIRAKGFVFEPWQVAAYVTAVRTKPFVILAGVTGVGKSRLPALVAEAAGAESHLVPVRPDWTDSADVLGYRDLQQTFRPGAFIEVARRAQDTPDHQVFCILDEMNLARVEQYLAEVLSRIEERGPAPGGGYASGPLLAMHLAEEGSGWSAVGLASNLAIVGTVNMDESAHGFSRKVLDRAFTIELSDVTLEQWRTTSGTASMASREWPVTAWRPRAISLGTLDGLLAAEEQEIDRVVAALEDLNRLLSAAQLQVGYRTRDEVALFVLHSRDLPDSFVDQSGASVDPLDLALHMKVLPRIAGGTASVRRTLLHLLGWAHGGKALASEDEAQSVLDEWERYGRPAALGGARFPRTAARLCLMWERLLGEGFTSYWL